MSEIGDWSDGLRFARILESPEAHPRLAGRWNPASAGILTRAPGRLDVMGGIADYSGALVLQMPIREATWIALQKVEERVLSLVSLSESLSDTAAVTTMSLDELETGGEPLSYAAAQTYFGSVPGKSWSAYIAGAFVVLMREKRSEFPHGASIVIQSDVPEGKGVASSAALEVASMKAIDAAYGLGIEPRELALLSQKVENLVVGAPCGIMDQMTAVFGEAYKLLALLCQPAELQATIALPKELAVWGIDSGIAHAVSGADYGSVRVGTFMGYRILQDMAGENWGGYLANLAPSELEQEYMARLPETISGADFLKQYGGTSDAVTRVIPEITYPVRRPTAHPIHEHFRSRTFARLLEGDACSNAPLLGELMYQSHASYSACGLGSGGTDRLVELARRAGHSEGTYGAKITGGGSGGTVAVLGRRDAGETVRAIAGQYAEETGYRPYIFDGSSQGAGAFGFIER
jgi:galactokinase